MRPSFLTIAKVTCIATEDTVGDDDLYGVLGPDTFSLGSYSADVVRTEFDPQLIPLGVTELKIWERDLLDPDDELGTIDLTQDMDIDRVFGILTGSARYSIEFKVISVAD